MHRAAVLPIDIFLQVLQIFLTVAHFAVFEIIEHLNIINIQKSFIIVLFHCLEICICNSLHLCKLVFVYRCSTLFFCICGFIGIRCFRLGFCRCFALCCRFRGIGRHRICHFNRIADRLLRSRIIAARTERSGHHQSEESGCQSLCIHVPFLSEVSAQSVQSSCSLIVIVCVVSGSTV